MVVTASPRRPGGAEQTPRSLASPWPSPTASPHRLAGPQVLISLLRSLPPSLPRPAATPVLRLRPDPGSLAPDPAWTESPPPPPEPQRRGRGKRGGGREGEQSGHWKGGRGSLPGRRGGGGASPPPPGGRGGGTHAQAGRERGVSISFCGQWGQRAAPGIFCSQYENDCVYSI